MNTPQILNAFGTASDLVRIIRWLISIIQLSDVIPWGLCFLQTRKNF